jgi:hypothetical protein
MGLDVYLYKYEDKAEAKRVSKLWEHIENSIYKETPGSAEPSQKLRKTRLAEAATKLGGMKLVGNPDMYQYWAPAGESKIEIDSTKYPEHMFKIGYLRSSYNDGGINQVLDSKGLGTLYDVFEPNDEYEFQPDWKACKERIVKLRKGYAEVMSGYKGKFIVTEIAHNMFTPVHELPSNKNTALEAFLKVYKSHPEETRNDILGPDFSNRDGHFFLNGLKVLGVLPGMGTLDRPCVYIVSEKKESADDDYYSQALEITEEMIDWVLAQPDVEKFWLHWSS